MELPSLDWIAINDTTSHIVRALGSFALLLLLFATRSERLPHPGATPADEAGEEARLYACPSCFYPYDLMDYRVDEEHWTCVRCGGALLPEWEPEGPFH